MGLSAAGLLYTAAGVLYNSAGLLWSTVGTACGCCGPMSGGATLYAKVCPCHAFIDQVYAPIEEIGDCALPEGECLYIDLRSVIDDDPGVTVAQRIFETYPAAYNDPNCVINIGGVCYRFLAPWALYADPALSAEERIDAAIALGVHERVWGNESGDVYLDLPDGATTAGGNGVELALSLGGEGFGPCSEEAGCDAAVNTGSDFFEAFACTGELTTRLFVCARAAYGGRILDPGDGSCACIDFTAVFTAGEVAALELEAGLTLHTLDPQWKVVWTTGSGHPNREPSPSCCFCGETCLTGADWRNWSGEDEWWPLDVCCGPEADLRYEVDLTYVRTVVSTIAPGDVLTTTQTVTAIVVTDATGGGSDVEVTITQRAVRPAASIDETTTSTFDVELNPVCCLPWSGLFPSVGTMAAGATTFVDDWDGSTQTFYERTLSGDGPSQTPPIGDDDYRLRLAWAATPWASGLPLCQPGGGGDEVYSGGISNTFIRSCRYPVFRYTGSFVATGRTDTVEVNLAVRVVPGETGDGGCGWNGPCGSAGWGEVGLEEMVP